MKRPLGLMILLGLLAGHLPAWSQTEMDADMMARHLFCVGPMYGYSSWKNYWEGTLKRDNQNLGTVSTQMYSLMGTYGITNDLNVVVNVPYVTTKASAGTMHGMHGFQDLSVYAKWRPYTLKAGNSQVHVLGLLGYTVPMSNYMADYLPLSLGMHSQNVTGRIMGDYQYRNVFVTASAAYIYRSDITIDRDAYYTTEMHLTNKVDMPNVANYNVRAGFRTKSVVAEAVVNQETTLGGFDITRNNMPFPSNRMNMTSVGAHFRYLTKGVPLDLSAGADYTVAGRNAGQSLMLEAGINYIFNFNHASKNRFQFKN